MTGTRQLATGGMLLPGLAGGGAQGQTPAATGVSSQVMFERIATVLQSPRCMNCHTDAAHPFPRQGDDRHRRPPRGSLSKSLSSTAREQSTTTARLEH